MDYQQTVEYVIDENGMRKKVGSYAFYKLAIDDTLTIDGDLDIIAVRLAASQFGIRHRTRLKVEKIGSRGARITRLAQDPARVMYGRRGGRPLGAEALSVDALEVGGTVKLPWRVNKTTGERCAQDGIWQLITRATRRGEALGKAYYAAPTPTGVEVRRLK